MPDYQPQNPQPKKRYKRQTPVLHVPTRDEWRKLGYISAAVGGSVTTITTLIFGYKAVSAYLMYAKDIVIQHGLLMTTIYGVLAATGLTLLLFHLSRSVRASFAITARHRPGYLLDAAGNNLATLVLFAGLSFVTTRAMKSIVGLLGRLKDLQKPHYPIAYDITYLSKADSAADAFKTYIPHNNLLFFGVTGVLALTIVAFAAFYHDKLKTLTEAQELTPEEHAERQLGLNAIRKYVQDRNYQPTREQAAVLLFMYDHVHPEDWIWSDYDPNRRMRTYHKDESNELTTFFQSSTDFDNYLKRVWKTYVKGQNFTSDDSTIIIDADDLRYVNVNTGTSVKNNGVCYTTVKMSRNTPDNIKQMLEQYIETADKRITDYLDL